ncbi:MAG: AI-2E family transporter [Acidobacteriota bacterium]
MSTAASHRFALTDLAILVTCFVIIVAGMRAAANLVVTFLLAGFLAVILTPPYLALRRRKVPAIVAVALIIGMISAVATGIIAVVGTSVSQFDENLPVYRERISAEVDRALVWVDGYGLHLPKEQVVGTFDGETALRWAGSLARGVSGVLNQSFIILLIVVFLLVDASTLPQRACGPGGLSRDSWDVIQEVMGNVRRYMAMKTMMSLLTGGLVTLWLLVMGVDYAPLFGMIAFLFNYVPNIGSFVASIPGVLVALVEHGGLLAMVVAIGYMAINVGVSNGIEPRYLGGGLGLAPSVVVLSLIFWGWVLGPVGMLLSVPLTIIARIVMDSFDETRLLAKLLGPARRRRPARPRPARRAIDRPTDDEPTEAVPTITGF